jgi:hypothetical protein
MDHGRLAASSKTTGSPPPPLLLSLSPLLCFDLTLPSSQSSTSPSLLLYFDSTTPLPCACVLYQLLSPTSRGHYCRRRGGNLEVTSVSSSTDGSIFMNCFRVPTRLPSPCRAPIFPLSLKKCGWGAQPADLIQVRLTSAALLPPLRKQALL